MVEAKIKWIEARCAWHIFCGRCSEFLGQHSLAGLTMLIRYRRGRPWGVYREDAAAGSWAWTQKNIHKGRPRGESLAKAVAGTPRDHPARPYLEDLSKLHNALRTVDGPPPQVLGSGRFVVLCPGCDEPNVLKVPPVDLNRRRREATQSVECTACGEAVPCPLGEWKYFIFCPTFSSIPTHSLITLEKGDVDRAWRRISAIRR